jgi:hypothetical protein
MRPKYFASFVLLAFVFFLCGKLNAQGTCATAVNLGTPGSTSSCVNLTNGATGSAGCAGAGYGGSGGVTYVRFCTNASNSCINFNITQGTASGNWNVIIYSGTTCATSVANDCLGTSGTGATFNTSAMGLAANTCYIARIWSANAGSFDLCTQTIIPPNDYCSSPTAISTSPQSFNNFCVTAGSNGSYTEPAAGQFCAGSLENNAWYSFTTLSTCLSPCTVTITIAGINCSGGGAGFQLGFWTGACGSLSNIGCTSGSGGTVTATINSLGPNQTVIVGMDGNAGANCTYSMSATNTIPLPIEFVDLELLKGEGFVTVKWSTASETNNAFFTVEKTNDGSHFSEVGKVFSSGDSHQTQHYSFKDENPYFGISYYRIRQTDLDGTFTYSQMKAVDYQNSVKAGFEIVPNPSENSSSASLFFTDLKGKECNISVFDITGKKIFTSTEVLKESKSSLPSFEKGVYFIQVSGAEFMQTKRMIVN